MTLGGQLPWVTSRMDVSGNCGHGPAENNGTKDRRLNMSQASARDAVRIKIPSLLPSTERRGAAGHYDAATSCLGLLAASEISAAGRGQLYPFWLNFNFGKGCFEVAASGSCAFAEAGSAPD